MWITRSKSYFPFLSNLTLQSSRAEKDPQGKQTAGRACLALQRPAVTHHTQPTDSLHHHNLVAVAARASTLSSKGVDSQI